MHLNTYWSLWVPTLCADHVTPGVFNFLLYKCSNSVAGALKNDQQHERLESMSCVQLKADKMSHLKRRDLRETILGSSSIMFSKRLMCESYRKLHFILNTEKGINKELSRSESKVRKGKGCSEETNDLGLTSAGVFQSAWGHWCVGGHLRQVNHRCEGTVG